MLLNCATFPAGSSAGNAQPLPEWGVAVGSSRPFVDLARQDRFRGGELERNKAEIAEEAEFTAVNEHPETISNAGPPTHSRP